MRDRRIITHRLSFLLVLSAASLAGCGRGDVHNALAPDSRAPAGRLAAVNAGGAITLPFNSSNFTNGVQNTYFPLVPRTTWTYRQETPDGVETDNVEVTRNTRSILGVTTYVVHDQVFLNGTLAEDTYDWYAPDNQGNVWYFGEDTKSYEGGTVSTVGSWEAGENGALPGIIMLAHPNVGDTYQQENSPGVVADMARVKDLNTTVVVPYGTFTGCLKTQEWTPLEPGNRAFKYYAPGIGIVVEEENKAGGPVELTGFAAP